MHFPKPRSTSVHSYWQRKWLQGSTDTFRLGLSRRPTHTALLFTFLHNPTCAFTSLHHFTLDLLFLANFWRDWEGNNQFGGGWDLQLLNIRDKLHALVACDFSPLAPGPQRSLWNKTYSEHLGSSSRECSESVAVLGGVVNPLEQGSPCTGCCAGFI